MQSIIILDPICINNQHYFFNFSILKNIVHFKSGIKINFYCYKSNTKIINSCEILDINISPQKEYFSYVIKTVLFFCNVFYRKSLLKTKKIIFFSIDNSILPFLFIINFFLIPITYKKIIIISHNNLHTIKNNGFKRFIIKFFLYLYQPKVIVLYPSLANEFQRVSKYKNVHGLFHHNYRNEIEDNFHLHRLNKHFESRIKTILITYSHSKIFIKKLNAYLQKQNKKIFQQEEKVIVKYVSDNNILVKKIGGIRFQRMSRPNDMNSYFKMIHDADFIFFPFDEISNLRASGVLMDSLSIGTNFIAPNVGHFRDINKKYELGLLYDDFDNICSIINEVSKAEEKVLIKDPNFEKFCIDTDPSILVNYLFS